MRVIAGKYRHLSIEQPISDKTRPTQDRVKEALGSILSTRIEGSKILDLFAGSGGIGIELLSRGAKEAVFVDADKVAIKTITSNLKKLQVSENYQIHHNDFQSYLSLAKERNEVFDIVYLDPPYRYECYQEIADYLLTNHLLSKDGILIFEGDHPFLQNENFTKFKTYKYGKKYLTVYWR